MDLFIEHTLSFEKVAAETALPEDPNAWPHEILQELFKQVPFIADFEPHIVMDKVDAEHGYGFGHVQVMNKTELQTDAPPDALESAGIRPARIPVIIRDNMLLAFDTLITADAKVVPLTEQRLRQAVFRPQAFDITSKTPGDQSLISQLYPPFRQNYGGMGGVTMNVGMGKEGSMLAAVLPTARPRDYARFFEQVENKEVQAAFISNGHATAKALETIAGADPSSTFDKQASILPRVLKPTVVQLIKAAEGYVVKAANHRFWSPLIETLDRRDVLRRFGEKVVLAADLNGSVTMAEGAEASEEEAAPGMPELIKDFGIYKVEDQQGRELVGYVFPNLLDIDGTPLPMALFTNGSQAAVQGEIVGVRVGDAVPIHEGSPQGKGCFFVMAGGEAHATMPLEVHGGLTQNPEEGAALMAETVDGRQVTVHLQPNIQELQLVDGDLLIPAEYKWLSLEGAEDVVLASTPDDTGKQADARTPITHVTVRGHGTNNFSFEGLALVKLAHDQTQDVSFDDALFLLAGLGTNLQYAIDKLAAASAGLRPIDICIGRMISTAGEGMEAAKTAASKRLQGLPDLRRDLVKEAAVIPDPVAVDTVLSLGFVNPENITSFVSSMPQIEEAQQRMCELLVAARLGLKELPVSALEKAIRSTEEVLEGLKVLAFQQN